MKLVTAVIRSRMLDDVKAALAAFGVADTTVAHSFGCDEVRTELGHRVPYRIGRVPMTRLEVMVDPLDAQVVATVIAATARTGTEGDGEVRISGVDRVIRVGGGQLCWNGA